jgi:hypothetical protein
MADGLQKLVSDGRRLLASLTDDEFVAAWRMLVGEPPAIMLSDRGVMIRLLVSATASADLPVRDNVDKCLPDREGASTCHGSSSVNAIKPEHSRLHRLR